MRTRLNPKTTYRSFKWLFSMKKKGLSNARIARICGVNEKAVHEWVVRLKVDKYLNMERYSDDYYEWRTKVFGRDGYRCVRCGATEQLHAHHIKTWNDYPKLRLKVSNGETLCETCHKKQHPWMELLYDSRVPKN